MIPDVNLGMGENRWQRYFTHELKRDPTTVLQGLVNPMEPSASRFIQPLLLIDTCTGTDPWCPAVTIDLAQFPIILDGLRRADIPGSIGSPSPPQVNLYHKHVSGWRLHYDPSCRTDQPWYPTRNLFCIVEGSSCCGDL
jgi:hypothetical protein